jgi:SAM-dependent methyltransferase
MISSIFGISAIVSFMFSRRPLRFALSVMAIFLAAGFSTANEGRILYSERSFFGITRVAQKDSGQSHWIMHGRTVHGGQWIDPARSREPLAYYFRTGPLGQFFGAFDSGTALRRIAVVGLGTGSIAAYAVPGQQWTYYEIDPVVVDVARDPRFFTYLRDCAADLKVILGDGRLSLQLARDAEFDLIILDAYNSDSLPFHLLTREALQLYVKKLDPAGFLIFHISNRYLDIEPVLGKLARNAGLFSVAQSDTIISESEVDQGKTASRYVLMTRNRANLETINSDSRWMQTRAPVDQMEWTDNYASILEVLRRDR